MKLIVQKDDKNEQYRLKLQQCIKGLSDDRLSWLTFVV